MRLLKPGAALVLSGILAVQAESVAAAYAELGTPKTVISGDWAALSWS